MSGVDEGKSEKDTNTLLFMAPELVTGAWSQEGLGRKQCVPDGLEGKNLGAN